MFTIHFSKPPKKLSKKFKSLKKKQGHTIHEAEGLILAVQNDISQDVQLNIIAKQVNGQQNLEFDPLLVRAKGSPISLIDELTQEITESDMEDEDVREIVNAMTDQYFQEEKFSADHGQVNQPKTEEPQQKANVFNPLKQLFGKKKAEKVAAEDFSDLISVDEADQDTAEEDFRDNEDFKELEAEEADNEHEEETTYEEEDESFSEDQDVDPFAQDQDYETKETVFEEKPQEDVKVAVKKHETVNFPNLDEYTDLSVLNETIDRHKNQFKEDHLLKLLNLPKHDRPEQLSKLDQKKVNYAINELGRTDLQEELQQFRNKLSSLVEKTKLNLGEIHNEALLSDYSTEAEDVIGHELDELQENFEQTIEEYKAKEEEVFYTKVQRLETQQEQALQAFIREQELEKEAFVSELEEKKLANIDLYEHSLEEKFETKKEDMIDNQMYRQKQEATNTLRTLKKDLLVMFDSEIEEGANETKEDIKPFLKEIRENIVKHEGRWKEEVDREEKLLIDQRKLELEEKDLELKRDHVSMLRQNAVEKRLEVNVEEPNKLDLIIKELSALKDNQHSQVFYPAITNTDAPKGHSFRGEEPGNSQTKTGAALSGKTLLGMATAGLIFLTGFGYVVNSMSSSPEEAQDEEVRVNSTVSAQEQTVPEEVEDTDIASIEKKLSQLIEQRLEELDPTITEVDFMNLLQEGSFEEALEAVNEKEDYELIVSAMYTQNELKALKEFNKKHSTVYGELYEALKENDNDFVVEFAKKAKDSVLENLEEQAKRDIAIILYQEDHVDLAGQVLEPKTKK